MKDDSYKEFLDELHLSYEDETFTSSYDTEVLWFPENQSLFIRGTDSPLDFIFNFLFWPGDLGFHYGFTLKARNLIEKMDELGIIPTTVVGHSAGGAVAQLVGFEYNCEVYSLASPKTTTGENKHFMDWANKNLVIIIQENDIISKVPPIILHHPVKPLVLNTTDYPSFAHNLISFE